MFGEGTRLGLAIVVGVVLVHPPSVAKNVRVEAKSDGFATPSNERDTSDLDDDGPTEFKLSPPSPSSLDYYPISQSNINFPI